MLQGNFTHNSTIVKLNSGKICLLDADFIKYHVVDIRRKELLNNADPNDLMACERITKEYIHNCFFNKIEDPIIFCFSGKSWNTHRDLCAIEKKYKDRDYTEQYPGADAISFGAMEYIIANYISVLFADLEADDVVSALQCENTYIYSKDKDLIQVPGFHYDKDNNALKEISKQEALYNLCYQIIRGDSTDNICGIPQYGPKKTEDFLNSIQNKSYSIVKILELYSTKFGIFEGTDRFVETYNLVKMRMNRGDYFKEKYASMFATKNYLIETLKLKLK